MTVRAMADAVGVGLATSTRPKVIPMTRTQIRSMTALAATSAALAIGAPPALAGSDGCSGDCRAENAPARVVPALPTPLFAGRGHAVRVKTSKAVARRTAPRGAVAAGAGGTAPHAPDGRLLALGGTAFVLLAAGGGMVASGRGARA
jgi:hypothetical protein